MAVLAPIPSVRVRTATSVKIGCFLSVRSAYRRSCMGRLDGHAASEVDRDYSTLRGKHKGRKGHKVGSHRFSHWCRTEPTKGEHESTKTRDRPSAGHDSRGSTAKLVEHAEIRA